MVSMPSLILAEQVLQAIPRGPDSLYQRASSHPQAVPWSAFPTVFDDAR
jgi:hypothetical protein